MQAQKKLDTRAAAAYLDERSPRTLEAWRIQGKGPRYLKICGRVLYDVADLDAFLAECRRNPAERRAA